MAPRFARRVLVRIVAVVLAAGVGAGTSLDAHGGAGAAAAPRAGGGHGLWREPLIGIGVGAAVGIGAMRSDFHDAGCAVIDCRRVLEMDALGVIGAGTGVAIGRLFQKMRHGGS